MSTLTYDAKRCFLLVTHRHNGEPTNITRPVVWLSSVSRILFKTYTNLNHELLIKNRINKTRATLFIYFLSKYKHVLIVIRKQEVLSLLPKLFPLENIRVTISLFHEFINLNWPPLWISLLLSRTIIYRMLTSLRFWNSFSFYTK